MLKTAQASPGEENTKTFRMSWLRLYAILAFWVCVPLVVPIALLLATRALPTAIIGSMLLVGLLFELAWAVMIAVCFPVRLSAEGIRGFNFWGLPCTMTWDEVASATPSRFMGLPWRIVRSHRTRNALWLPLFMADNDGFRETLARFAPPSSPLR